MTLLRTAFLAYVRALLFLQGLFLELAALTVFTGGRGPLLAVVLALLGLAGIVTAFLLRRGRRWAAIAAILTEALWATAAAALVYKILRDWPFDWPTLWTFTAVAALFGVTVVGLLLRPVRAYAGLVRY